MPDPDDLPTPQQVARHQGYRKGYRAGLGDMVEQLDEQLAFLIDRWPPDMEPRTATLQGLRAWVRAQQAKAVRDE